MSDTNAAARAIIAEIISAEFSAGLSGEKGVYEQSTDEEIEQQYEQATGTKASEFLRYFIRDLRPAAERAAKLGRTSHR